jgi:3-deoxy-D-manno-octulosonic-acid transferase
MPDAAQKLTQPIWSDNTAGPGSPWGFLRWYNFFTLFSAALALPVLIPVLLLSEKRRKTAFHRMGLTRLPEMPIPPSSLKKPIWLHALSVGEVFSCINLIRALRNTIPDRPLVLSVSTATGHEVAVKRLGNQVERIVYFPYDLFFSVKRRIREIDPGIFVLVESDLWPNVMHRLQSLGIPSVWVNARLSASSFVRYFRFRKYVLPVFRVFSRVCLQSASEAARFEAMGLSRNSITVTGNLKFDQEAADNSPEMLRALKDSLRIEDRIPVLIAGSTHPGEETQILWVFERLRAIFPQLLLILAPRDPRRASSVFQLCLRSRRHAVRLSSPIETGWDILVVDTLGLLRQLYGISDIAFIGGSLEPCGGHNPLEASAAVCPAIFGPHMTDFSDIADMLVSAGAASQVENKVQLFETAAKLISDPVLARDMGKRAFQVFSTNRGAVDQTVRCIQHHLL